MILADVSIRRPVFAAMMILALLILGWVSFNRLSIELFPNIDFPIVVVSTPYPGAGAESVEIEVTRPIEDAVNPISGIDYIESTSSEGLSVVLIWFQLEVKSLDAAQEVRDKISAIRGNLPEDIDEPIIQRYDPQTAPVLSLVIAGNRSPRDLTYIVKENVKKRIENISGIGSVNLIGGYEREIQVELDLDKLEAHHVTPFHVRNAMLAANFELPGGSLKRTNSEILVRTMGRVTTIDDIKNLIIDTPEGHFVKLSDVANVYDGIKEQTSVAYLGNREDHNFALNRAISLDIITQSGANVVDVANNVKAELVNLRKELPPDITISVVQDRSTYTKEAVNDVVINLIYGSILAILVVFLFLANLRSTIITGVAIPVSIISTFTFMNALGFSLNFMTLLGLSLAVGLLIDDAIVVIENIYRHLSMDKTGAQAASDATSEIGLAVAATTFAIVVVFLPVAFMKGIVGRFFYSFGMTVAFSVMVSLFVAFTLTPMLSSKMLKPEKSHKGSKNPIFMVTNGWHRIFDWIGVTYKKMLHWSLHHRVIVMVVATAFFVGALGLVRVLGVEFMPVTDESQFYVSFQTAPESTLERTEDLVKEVENRLVDFPQVTTIYTVVGSQGNLNQGYIYVQLVPISKRKLSAQEIMIKARENLKDIPGIKTFVSGEQREGGNQAPIQIAIRGESINRLEYYTEIVDSIVRGTPGAVDVDNTLTKVKPEVQIQVDRKKAADLGLKLQDIGMGVRMLVEGQKSGRLRDVDEEYDILLRLQPNQRNSVRDLDRFLVPSSKDIPGVKNPAFPLSRVASFVSSGAPPEIDRYDRQRYYQVTANVAGAFAGTIRGEIQSRIDSIPLQPGYSIEPIGEAKWQKESFQYLGEALALAVIFIYLVLASLYNSFFDPVTIMTSLPLALIGAFLGLLMFNSPVSIMSFIGIIMLMGLVTKNAILLIDFVKQRRERGETREQAIMEAGPIRLRPIMMTALSLIFGMMPLALALGPGAELRAPIARAVIGGMISSTFLTLLVIPVVYTIVDDIVRLPGKIFKRKKADEPQKA
jgi:hydrophobe/amphiphile efflux-1 (HAE1) family protein